MEGKDKQVVSTIFDRQHRLENHTCLVEVIGLDIKNSNVLVWYHDQMMSSLVSVWVPVNFLKVPEIPLLPPAHSWTIDKLYGSLIESTVKSLSSLSRKLILSFI